MLCNPVNFGRLISKTQHIIKVKIMKLIRSHQIFCLLRNLTVLRRQKLRTYRCIQHIQQNLLKLFIPAGVRIVLYQMAHQRFRYRGVDTVHGHVVSVIRRPAKSKL